MKRVGGREEQEQGGEGGRPRGAAAGGLEQRSYFDRPFEAQSEGRHVLL
jgi:hypothetical protein